MPRAVPGGLLASLAPNTLQPDHQEAVEEVGRDRRDVDPCHQDRPPEVVEDLVGIGVQLALREPAPGHGLTRQLGLPRGDVGDVVEVGNRVRLEDERELFVLVGVVVRPGGAGVGQPPGHLRGRRLPAALRPVQIQNRAGDVSQRCERRPRQE